MSIRGKTFAVGLERDTSTNPFTYRFRLVNVSDSRSVVNGKKFTAENAPLGGAEWDIYKSDFIQGVKAFVERNVDEAEIRALDVETWADEKDRELTESIRSLLEDAGAKVI